MRIEAEVELPFPIERVFATYRDRMPELTPHLPNIRSITVRERREREGAVELVNEWVGGGDIPAVARAVLSESMLRWTDHATWWTAARAVDWRTEVHAFPGAVLSSGRNHFRATERGTLLAIRGELTCDAGKVPGVPRLLAKTIGQAVEKLLVGQVSVNLVEVGKGVGKLLAHDDASA